MPRRVKRYATKKRPSNVGKKKLYKRKGRRPTTKKNNPSKTTKATIGQNWTVCNPRRSIFPLTTIKTLYYQYRSNIQSLGAVGLWNERVYLNSMYDPDGSPNNLGNKQPIHFDTLCASTNAPYTAYKVLKTTICFKIKLLSAPGAYNADEAYAKNQEGTPDYSTQPGPAVVVYKPCMPLNVWVVPPFMSGDQAKYDTLAELVLTPGVKRYDLYRQFQHTIVKKSYTIASMVKRLGGSIDNSALRAVSTAHPTSLLEFPIIVSNPNTDSNQPLSFIVDLEIGMTAQFSGLNPYYSTE